MEHNNETPQLAMRRPNPQPFLYVEDEAFISGVSFVPETIGTSSLAQVNESGRAMEVRLRDNSASIGQLHDLQNAFDEIVEKEVQKRLKNLEQINIVQKRVSNIGGDLGKRQIEA